MAAILVKNHAASNFMPLRSNDRVPPLSSAEMQEKLRSGKVRIVSAPQDQCAVYKKEILALLEMIAPFMIEDGESIRDWAASCFVTDLSSVGDFLKDADEDTPADLKKLSHGLGFPVERGTLLCDIAATMRGI